MNGNYVVQFNTKTDVITILVVTELLLSSEKYKSFICVSEVVRARFMYFYAKTMYLLFIT